MDLLMACGAVNLPLEVLRRGNADSGPGFCAESEHVVVF